MRAWRLFSGSAASNDGAQQQQQQGQQASTTNTADGGGIAFRGFSANSSASAPASGDTPSGPGFMGFRSPRANQDARIEKEVSAAARNLGNGVQKIVLAAKAKQQDDEGQWKGELLELLGSPSASSLTTTTSSTEEGAGGEAEASAKPEKADIDVLLANSSCPTFALRCVENELPPNLIHCMRLLRVLELQHAASAPDGEESAVEPIGRKATMKVSRLLCKLCVDPSVGEQLRPHLFGLLALSGASYPPSGIHVAKAASDVILALSEHCLTRQLIWFIHDRKMVVHMTDDIKELCGQQPSANAAAASNDPSKGLTSLDAEKAGLWVIALETVIKLIYHSCRFQTIDLVKDFEAAGGYEILEYALMHSTRPHGSKLVELLPALLCCPNEQPPSSDDIDNKLATNVRVFDMLESLLVHSNPVLVEYRKRNGDSESLNVSEPGPLLPELVSLALEIGIDGRVVSVDKPVEPTEFYNYDVVSSLLSATLQLFSDHPDNFDILEERQHILTYYILSFPCIGDDDLKNFILKTLEFVLTGVGVKDEITPVNATVEVFFALCLALIRGEEALENVPAEQRSKAISILADDLDLMGRTLEKLLQFDQRVAPLMVESGILTTNLSSLLDLIAEYSAKMYGDDSHLPPQTTPLDGTFCIVCKVLKLLVPHQPVKANGAEAESTNLHTMLRRAIEDLGSEAAHGAGAVFEAYMSSFASLTGLENDMRFTNQLLEEFSNLPGSMGGESLETIVDREIVLLSMTRSVLEARSLARDAFRSCGGFDALIQVLLSFEGITSGSTLPVESLFALLQAVVGLLDAALGLRSKGPVAPHDATPLMFPVDITVDPLSSQMSLGSPSSLNRNFVRQRGYYRDLAVAIAATGILETKMANDVIGLCLLHMDPSLKSLEEANHAVTVRNPDALRLIIGVSAFMPKSDEGKSLSIVAMDTVLRLCEKDKGGSTLRELACTGICWTLTSNAEFGPILFDHDHHLRSRVVLLLSCIASFSMSYMDFVSLIRNILGPLLVSDSSDGRVRLPVISSSVRIRPSIISAGEPSSEESKLREVDFGDRLDMVSDIARNGDRYPRLVVGGESINTLAVLMHKVKLEERLKTAAEEGKLRFLEVECIDSAALNADTDPDADPANASAEKIWNPLVSSGFTYSIWLRHEADQESGASGNLYILDMSAPLTPASAANNQASPFLSVWYDLQSQRFNVMSSASYKAEPICFPVSPLVSGVWHHVLMTYSPSKRTMMSRKSAFSLFVNGRALEADIRVESVNLPPNSRLLVGAPNAALAASGIVRGVLPVWEIGPTIMLSTVLLDLDATAIFANGPTFPGILWGDRPQRTSLAATGTLAFSMLAESGEVGSVASALKRREVQRLETAGYCVLSHADEDKDDLSSLGLLCSIPPDCVIFAFQPATASNKIRAEYSKRTRSLHSERLLNLGRLNFSNENVSTDAVVYGASCVVSPLSFADCLQWAGGPSVLMPLVDAANTVRSLASSLQIVREGTKRHPPNLEAMQAGGGYRILAVLLKEKGFADERCLDECLAFAINGFNISEDQPRPGSSSGLGGPFSGVVESDWVLSDVDAMKHLVLNHQVWDLSKCGPTIPLRLLSALNVLVSQRSFHKAFNARRLHLVGIVRWALHLMIEGAELYVAGERAMRQSDNESNTDQNIEWYTDFPSVSDVLVGADPGNPFLLECKNLLRRVLTFMLTPGDLETVADAIVYTLSISSIGGSGTLTSREKDDRMLPGAAARLYLLRLLEELVVDGVNEIISTVPQTPKRKTNDADRNSQNPIQYHAGGVASPNQPYLSTTATRGMMADGSMHPKHQQAQAFLSAFAGFLTPVWFATVLEGCNEEASASAVLRLLILILQGSSAFESAFWAAGGFAPFVMSIPKFSTCAGVILSMLSELLNVPILHLHSLPTLDAEQLCEVFDAECREFTTNSHETSDPSTGIFALLAECLGRNIKICAEDSELSTKARETNMAVIQLISHRHHISSGFQEFCAMGSFLEPLAQALCLVYSERVSSHARGRRRSSLADVPRDMSPTERFVGGANDIDTGGMGMVRLLRMVIFTTLTSSPRAAIVFYTMFRAFPIHASAQQVEAFHLVLIEQCVSVIKEVVEQGDSITLANCLGACSVLLDQLLSAFFTAEGALETVKLSMSLLNSLTDVSTQGVRALSNAEHSILTTDAAHLANMVCVAALRLSLPSGIHDYGDDDLQAAVLAEMDGNIQSILLVPNRDRKSKKRIPSGNVAKPSQNSRLFPLWQSTSIARCLSQYKYAVYPDLNDSENPQVAVLAPLLVVLHRLLIGAREDVRSLAVSLFVALLQHRQNELSLLLVTEVNVGGQKETIDVISRGGFRALLAAHEAASVSERSNSASASVKRKYASFFEWFDRNQNQVQMVFDSVNEKSKKLFPGLERISVPQDVAIENEQKTMLMRLTAQASDNTILGGIERGELARRSAERTTDGHARWKRQGFDDLAFGATKWKTLLRQLKGSSSIWEGGSLSWEVTTVTLPDSLSELKSRNGKTKPLEYSGDNTDLVKRWKLDLSEGHERQRRRLLPNYEFHGLYNLDEAEGHEEEPEQIGDMSSVGQGESGASPEFLVGPEMEATAELLKDLNLKRAHREDEDDFDDAEGDDGLTVETSTTISTNNDAVSLSTQEGDNTEASKEKQQSDETKEKEGQDETDDSSSYGLITGLLQAGDWPEKSYNVRRCTGLEVTTALLLWCQDAIYIIDGFEQSGGAGMDGKITRVEREQSSFYISLRPKDFKATEEKSEEDMSISSEDKVSSSKHRRPFARTKSTIPSSTSDVLYQHRSQRIAFSDLFSVYRRRYQLQQSALEFYDVNKNGTLVAFSSHKEREEILSKVLQAKLPNSIFSSSYGTFISYSKFMNNLKSRIVSQWVNGKMSNFDFLMHLNSFAGRSFNDLTQYPVFPWVIADYESEEIDLNDPKTYRDLSKPMGAIGEQRAKQFRERYEALESTCFSEEDPPPFHYGTHYSCAAYVLYYLMRLEPFSRLALVLQGGRFDVADRLFHDIGRSWKSASSENLQDVRELIPEFYYLPDFLVNTNHFDFGETQRGKTVHDVSLPKWAKGDPLRFVRINRQALESDYVSRHLHEWIDLVFGYKQRGKEAVDALNVFVHVTYEGEVDLETMTDPVQKASTIAQIQNFGQTPSRLERKPFPPKQVGQALKDKAIDFGSLMMLAPLTPPFCVVGAPHRVSVKSTMTDTCKLGLTGQPDPSVGDMCLVKGQLIGVARTCALIIPAKKYFRFGGANCGVSVHAAVVSARFRELNKVVSFHDALHRAPITAAKTSLNGDWLVTGCSDSTLRVWYYNSNTLDLRATLCGHDGANITCIDVSTEFGVLASGCGQGRVLLWDLRSLTFVRGLQHDVKSLPAISVSINHSNGNVLTLVGSELHLFDINGNLLARTMNKDSDKPTCAVSTDCPEWMDGVVAVSGHLSGEVRFWGIDYDKKEFVLRSKLQDNPHTSTITALRVTSAQDSPDSRSSAVLRVTGADRQDTLLVGDASGMISVCKTVDLVSLSQAEIAEVVAELDT